MAMLDCSVRIQSHFCYPEGVEPKPSNKLEHMVRAPAMWHSRQCGRAVLDIGTHPTAARIENLNEYTGSSPKAPLMLGSTQSLRYGEGIQATKTKPMLLSVGAAILFGASLGVLAVGVVAVCCIPLARFGYDMSLHAFYMWSAVAAAAGAIVLAVNDIRDYTAASNRFKKLKHLSDMYVQEFSPRSPKFPSPEQEAKSQAICSEAFVKQDWALREAAMDFKAEKSKHTHVVYA